MTRILSAVLFSILFVLQGNAQDRLLLTNGKIKKLKGTVVYYDFNDIFYQSERARDLLIRDSTSRAEKLQKLKSTPEWQEKEQAKAERKTEKQAKQKAKEDALKAKYQRDLPTREQTLEPADFERWKQQKEAEIKDLELKHQMYWKLRDRGEQDDFDFKEARFRSKYTRSKSRGNVFSILREDGSEEIVYNADTLGLLADGEYEVEYGVADMRLYIKGRQDGRKHSLHDIGIGAGVGLGSGLLFTYTLDMFYAPIPPAICIAVIAGLNNYKPNPKLELTKAMLDSDPYMDGYIKSAKGRKIFGFTMGAIGGLGIGIGTAVATSPLLR